MRYVKFSKTVLFIMIIFLGLSIFSCVSTTDPDTGEIIKSLDPEVVENITKIGETGSSVLGILGTIWPILLPIAGYIGGAIRVSKKLTPKLTEAQSETQMYHTIASSTVLGIDEFKKEFPDEWASLRPKLEALKGKVIGPEDLLKIENVIRGLRGLPPKA